MYIRRCQLDDILFQIGLNFGAIQKLHGQDFDHFWLPTYLDVAFFTLNMDKNKHFLTAYHLSTSFCPRSFWTTPFAILICQCIKVYETHITNFYQLASQICQNEFTRVELAGSNFWAKISVWWAVQLCAAKVRSC